MNSGMRILRPVLRSNRSSSKLWNESAITSYAYARKYSVLINNTNSVEHSTAIDRKRFASKPLGKQSTTSIMTIRNLSIQQITKNMHLFLEEPRKIKTDPKTLRLEQNSNDKPLVVLMAWLRANPKHMKKFAQIYIDQGFDVLVTHVTAWQLLWPVKGTQTVAVDIAKFLENNENYKQILIHGFSVAGYAFGEILAHMSKDLPKYEGVIKRICGQIWDSAADITEIPVGVPKAMFPDNQRLQIAVRNYMQYHLKTFHDSATQHYIRSSQMFHTNLVQAPALFILSKTDPVGAESSNRRVADSWISMGMDVTWKCFEKSPHVGHFLYHRDDYIEFMYNHLVKINLMKHPERLRAKL